MKAKSKVIILLTDGEQTAGVLSPLEGAKIAKTLGVKVYTIGIGTNGMVTIPDPYPDAFGRRVLHQEVFPMDEHTLRQIADATGGKYFNAQDTAAGWRTFTPRSTGWKKAPPRAGSTPSIASCINGSCCPAWG